MKATVKEDLISYEEILSRTNGGYDGFMYYNGSVPKKCRRPWGRDRSPSFGFFTKENIWFYRDFATEEAGTLVEFVMKMFNLTWKEAIDKIKWDFGLSKVQNLNAVKVTWERPIVEEKPTLITWKLMKFEERHKAFWSPVGISEEYCKKYDCYAIKELTINRTKIPITKSERVFLYWCEELKKSKVYFPDRPSNKFKGNVPGTYLWYLDRYDNCEKLGVCKSNKDAIVLSQFGLCVSATQNEGISCIEPNVNKLNIKTKNVYIIFGNDDQGRNESFKITKKYGYKHFNIPQEELKLGINDPYLYTLKYGVDKMQNLLQIKNLI